MVDIDFPERVKGETLDNYLSRGWFRCGFMMHTIDSIVLDNVNYPAYWLRYRIEAIQLSKKNLSIIAENKRFNVECYPFKLTNEMQDLFSRYQRELKFKINADLFRILRDVDCQKFDSRIIEVRDNGQLIAAGIFDIGHHSIQDIINFYDPAYKKYSLGKYLMLCKYKYCLKYGYTYYYPGYYIPEQNVFSYKLFLDKNATEAYLPNNNIWMRYHDFIS